MTTPHADRDRSEQPYDPANSTPTMSSDESTILTPELWDAVRLITPEEAARALGFRRAECPECGGVRLAAAEAHTMSCSRWHASAANDAEDDEGAQ